MKRGSPDHWKMRELAMLMKVPARYALPWANGVMERLWHYTAKYHPQGDVGKAPNWAIAEACGCAPGSANELVDALVDAKWLDLDKTHRLIVHDWHEHADESVRKTLKNRNLSFFFPEKSASPAGKFKPALAFPLPLPLQQQPPENSGTAETPVVVVETLCAIRERFPTANQKFARKLAEKVHEGCADASDCEIADAVRAAWFRSQVSAGAYLETVPAIVQTIRAQARAPDPPADEELAHNRARELWSNSKTPEDRAEVERLWPDLWPKGATNDEKHAS
jgi:hypothetical protein